MDFASLCFLSYNRPQFLREAIESAHVNAHYPHEIIVHDDGSTDPEVYRVLENLRDQGTLSTVILNARGHNEGVGRSFNRAAAAASGDPIIKIDQDLLFQPGWLRRTVDLLSRDTDVGCAGLFKYPVDPVDWRKMQIDWEPEYELVPVPGIEPYHYVADFVGSAIAIPSEVWDEYGPWPEYSDAFAEDVEFKLGLRARGMRLALPDDDLATNRGFGVGPSTVVIAPQTVQTIHHGPLVHDA